VQAHTGALDPVECELRGRIGLIQGIASGDKMDWVVEKAVELGVSDLYPIAAERSVLKLAGPRLEKRLAHWRAVVCAASEQCGRNRLMRVHAPTALDRCLDELPGSTLFCHPDGERDLAAALGTTGDVLNIAVGPEGGWSPGELDRARRRSLQAIRFGSRVLRTETAGITLVAAATALLGW
jgi:16S rRNA (uracil1498-N3)-methyltransferase